ncbi:hypothetical protein AKJ16_DCAP26810 [Drosera capensis]
MHWLGSGYLLLLVQIRMRTLMNELKKILGETKIALVTLPPPSVERVRFSVLDDELVWNSNSSLTVGTRGLPCSLTPSSNAMIDCFHVGYLSVLGFVNIKIENMYSLPST